MSEPALILKIARLKCDAPSCDYEDTEARLTVELVGKPCPKCGANLLTEEDFLLCKQLEVLTELTNHHFKPSPDGCRRETIRLHMDGTGAEGLTWEIPK